MTAPMHPFSAPTQNVSIIPFWETDTDNWSQIFLLAGHKETSYSPLCSCLLSVLPSPLSRSSPPPPEQHWAAPHPQHSPFHCHNKAIRMRDPTSKPPFLSSSCLKVAVTSVGPLTSHWFSLMSAVVLIKNAPTLIRAHPQNVRHVVWKGKRGQISSETHYYQMLHLLKAELLSIAHFAC